MRRFKWLRRGILLLSGLALLAALLPKMTGGPRLAGYLADRLSSVTSVPVRIGEVRWDWWSGLQLNDLLARMEDGSQIAVDRAAVRMGLWDLLGGHGPRDVRLDGVTIHLATRPADDAPARAGTADPGGAVRAAAKARAARLMQQRKPGKPSPVNTLPIDRLVVNRCSVTFHDSESERLTSVLLPTAQASLDRRTGAVHWWLLARVGRDGLVTTEGSLILQKLAVAPKDFGGRLQVRLRNLPLDALPSALLSRLGVKSAAGQLTGRLQLGLAPDPTFWTVTYDISATAADLTLHGDGRAVRIVRAGAGLAGQWQMLPGRFEVANAWLELPGLRIAAADPGLIYDGRARQLVRARVGGEIGDAGALRSFLTDLGLPLSPRVDLAGQADFQLLADRQADGTRIELNAHGGRLAASWEGLLRHQAGTPLDVVAVWRLLDDGRLLLEGGRIELPGGRVAATAELVSVPGEHPRHLALRRADAEIRWEDFETLAGQCPVVAAPLASAGSVRGGGRAGLQVAADERGGLKADVSVALSEAARVQLGNWLDKPRGRDLRLQVRSAVGSGYNSLTIDHVLLESADEPLIRLEDVRARAGRQVRRGKGAASPGLLVDLHAGLAWADLSGLLSFSPRLAKAVGEAGRVEGTFQASADIACWADLRAERLQLSGLQAAVQVDLDRAVLDLEGLVRKSAADRLRLAGAGSCSWGGGDDHGYASVSMEADGFAAQGWYESSAGGADPSQWAWGWLEVRDLRRTMAAWPAVAQAAWRDEISGQAQARWEWSRHAESFDLHALFDLTGLRATRPAAGIDKPAGLPARIDAVVCGPAGEAAGHSARQWRLPRAEFTLGQSRASIRDGEMEISDAWAKLLAGQGREALSAWRSSWPVRRARATVSGVTVFGEPPVSENVQMWLAPYGIAGPVQWTLDGSYEFARGMTFAADVEARDLSVATAMLNKPGGTPLRAAVRGRIEASRDPNNGPQVHLVVTEASGSVSSLEWKASGEALCRLADERLELVTARLTSGGQSRRLEQVASLLPAAAGLRLSGHGAWEGVCSFEKRAGWRIDDLDVGLWPVEGTVFGMPCRLAGLLNVRQDRLRATGLAAQLGATDGRFTLDLVRQGAGLSGQVGMAFAMIDLDELLGVYKRIDAHTSPSGDTSGGRESPPPAGDPAAAGAGRAGPASVDLARSHLEFFGQTEGLRYTLADGREPVRMRLLGWEGSLDGGDLKADLTGAFEGGGLVATVASTLDGAAPCKIRYRVDRALPTELTQYLVVESFPGMRVDGPVTLEETLLIDPSSPTIPSSGEMIVEGGEVWGAAAPRSIQRIFPKLELARFEFSRLHNWFEKDAGGRTTNRFIYRGSPWSLYMNGWSDPDGTFRYEIGVDLLGPMESEYWATADRGRVPLFIKTGQVIDGQLHNEVIRYLLPQQIAGRILKDNLLTIAYHAVRQQILRGQAGRADAGRTKTVPAVPPAGSVASQPGPSR